MWKCPECGCEGIIIGHCPACGAPKPESEEEMPKSTVGTVDGEVPEEPLPLPPKSALKADHVEYAVQQGRVNRESAENLTKDELIALNYGEESSAGSSSLTSENKPEPSGSSAPETGPSLQSHAQGTESLSAEGSSQPRDRSPESSDAGSADGPTQETGRPQRSRGTSSEAGTSEERGSRRGGRPD